MNNLTRAKMSATIVFVILTLSCTRQVDCPFCPDNDVPAAVSDYNFYMTDHGSTSLSIFIYNSAADSIVDSVYYGDGPIPWEVEVSEDEKYLFTTSRAGGPKGWIYDLDSKAMIKQLDFGGEIEVSPNGKYVAFQAADSFRVLDAATFELVLIDSGATYGGHFDSVGNTFYGLRSGNRIRRYDLAADSIYADVAWTNNGSPGPPIRRLVPAGDGSKVFMLIVYQDNFSQVVSYRFENGVTSLNFWIGSLNSDLEITPDGKTLVFTDPFNGQTSLPPLTSNNIFFVNVQTEQAIDVVPAPTFAVKGDSTRRGPMSLQQLAISPDGRLCLFGSETSGTDHFCLLSLKNREWMHCNSHFLDVGGAPFSVACRKRD